MKKIKKCPFCGGVATLVQYINSYVQCKECLASTSTSYDEDIAITVWNTRLEHRGKSVEINWEQRKWDLASELYNKINAEIFALHCNKEIEFSCEPAVTRAEFCVKAAEVFINRYKEMNNEK